MSLVTPSGQAKWRIIAKDGSDVPVSQSRWRAANLQMAPGEIYDVEVLPARGVPLNLEYWHTDPKEKSRRVLVLTRKDQ